MRNLLILMICITVVFFAEVVGGSVEGHFLPVTSQAEIEGTEPAGPGHTRFWGQIRKKRDCAFVRIEWRLGAPGRYAAGAFAVADLRFEEQTQVRPAGPFAFGPWRIQLSEDQLLHRSHAVVFHRCHWFWLTETLLYDSRAQAE